MSPKAKHALLEALAETTPRTGGASGTAESYPEFDPKTLSLLAECCVSCGRCRLECSRSLSVPVALAAARAAQPGWRQWFWKNWILSGKLIWPTAAAFSRFMPALGKDGSFIRENIRSAKAMNGPDAPAPWLAFSPGKNGANEPVALFAGCTAARVRKSWGDKAFRLLAAKGFSPIPDKHFTCCGATLDHAGIPDAALNAARENITVWRTAGSPKLAVFCASCHHGLAHYPAMPGLFTDETEAARWLAALTPLSRFFSPTEFSPTDHAPTSSRYHSPCHWEKKDPDLTLLRTALPGLSQGEGICCGLGGVVKLANPGLSMDLARACWAGLASPENPTEKNSPPVLTGCSGCVMQLGATAPEGSTVHHWLDVVSVE